jgi:hypothetical protein
MNALLLLDDGWAAERVAAALFLDTETVHEHRRLYQTAGVSGVERLHYEGSEAALTAEQLKALGRFCQQSRHLISLNGSAALMLKRLPGRGVR